MSIRSLAVKCGVALLATTQIGLASARLVRAEATPQKTPEIPSVQDSAAVSKCRASYKDLKYWAGAVKEMTGTDLLKQMLEQQKTTQEEVDTAFDQECAKTPQEITDALNARISEMFMGMVMKSARDEAKARIFNKYLNKFVETHEHSGK